MPELLGGEAGAFAERGEFGGGDLWMDAAAEAAVRRGDHPFAAHEAGEAFDDPAAYIGVYCGGGVASSFAAMAFAVDGLDVTRYPDGWSGWTARPDRPIEVGLVAP